LKEKEEWILILKKIIGQDQSAKLKADFQLDRQDNAAFGRKAPRRGREDS